MILHLQEGKLMEISTVRCTACHGLAALLLAGAPAIRAQAGPQGTPYAADAKAFLDTWLKEQNRAAAAR
jgi:hypothetical protein